MPHDYNPSIIEAKWQKHWEEARVYQIDLAKAKNPYYALMMFPYPSGDRLHIGHWYSYAPADSYYRFQRMRGKDVFEPMGFDAFGLPAENHAIKTGVHPDASTKKNVATMIEQLRRMGCMFDWEKTVNTSDPSYYRFTQWLFLQMHKNNLAYRKEGNVNFCPSCQTVLANEQAQEGTCERCGTEVLKKPLTQWFWRITKYAQKLLDNLKDLDWPERTKLMQTNWIGRNEGVNITSRIKDLGDTFEVFDSVPQTFMAQTFTVIAPEHPLVAKMVKGTPLEKEVMTFVERVKKLKATEKYNFEEHVEGIFTGRYVADPFGTGDLPIWVASFVVMEYGTGIVHCSAHDERDFAFAKKYGIPLRPVMFPDDPVEALKVRKLEYCYAKDPEGILEKPNAFKGRRWGEVRSDIIEHMTKKMRIAKPTVQYRLRDWLVSRQRYWGAPIPIVYDPEGRPHPIPDEHLPWLLPTDIAFKPTGKSPLTESKEFIDRTERTFGKGWRPEFDTMDTFVCSSFYYLRYITPHPNPLPRGEGARNAESILTRSSSPLPSGEGKGEGAFVDAALAKKWMPVQCYIGGAEHACMHLIYARFVMMALKDFGFVRQEEPFKKLVHQGTITHKGAKMSKSRGNVVSPDAFVDLHGSDAFRMYLMFMGPLSEGGDWSDTGIKGIDRFIQRVWKFMEPLFETKNLNKKIVQENRDILCALHRTVKRVTEDIDRMHFNTALAALMELLSALERAGESQIQTARTFTLLLAPLAPHLAEELWERLGGEGFAIDQEWPSFDPQYLASDTVTIAVQVMGKLRGDITLPSASMKEEILRAAKEHVNVRKHLAGKTVQKEIYVPGKLVNFVVG